MTSYMSQVIQIHIISYQEYHNSSSLEFHHLRDSRYITHSNTFRVVLVGCAVYHS